MSEAADPLTVALLPSTPHSSISFWTVVVALAGVLVLVRLYFKLRGATKGAREAGWDAREVERLRRQGYAPFKEYPVDFFLALPDTQACEAARRQLEPQGFTVDVKTMEDDATLHYSLHATRTMRLLVPDMEERSRQMTRLAQDLQGRYDGWAA